MARAGGILYEHFSFAEITWTIKNISLAVCPSKTTINSDEFQISGSFDTVWRLSIVISHEKNEFLLCLKLLAPDLNFCPTNDPENVVRISWLATLLDSNGEGSLSSESRHQFRTRDNMVMENFELSEIVNNLPHVQPDDLSLKCFMLIHHGGQVDLTPNVPNGLIDLSNALAKVPIGCLFPDVNVHVGKKTFFLHKDMFSNARHFDRLIHFQTTRRVRLVNYDETSTENLLRYVYSGNLHYVVTVPRIRICEDIKRLDIPELTNVYPKEKIELQTTIAAREYDFSWRLDNFELIEYALNGPELNKEGMNSRWQLRLLPRGKLDGNEQEKKYVFFEVLLLQTADEIVNVSFQFDSLDRENKLYYSRRDHKKMRAGDKLELPFFRRGGTLMKNCLVDKGLVMRITLWISTGDTIVGLGNVIGPVSSDLDNTLTLNLMSRKMNSILHNPQSSDVLLQAEKQTFRAHKFVLACRSSELKMTLTGFTGTALTIENIRKHFVRVFLENLYTGLFPDLEFETNCHMYELGIRYNLSHLKTRCKQELNPDIVLDVLVYADDMNLYHLKDAALNLIARIGEAIIGHYGWREFSRKKSNMACKIMKIFGIDTGN